MAQFPQVPPPWPAAPPPVQPPRRGNGAAVVSLVLGIFGCIPEVTGVLAIILGVIGLRRARDPNVGGKGLAAAGLTLGIVSVVLWTAGIGIVGAMWHGSAPARDLAREYLDDFARQDVPAIMAASTRSVTEPQVRALSYRLRRLGPLQDVRFTGVYCNFGQPAQWTLNGQASYANGEAVFTIQIVRRADAWKVNSFWIRGAGPDEQPKDENQPV